MMLLRSLNIGLILFLLVCTANAQELRITVHEKNNRQTIPLAYVTLFSYPNHSLEQSTQSDDFGNAVLSNLKYPCTIEITGLGFEPYTREFLTAPANNNIDIALEKKYGSLNEVVVTGVAQPVKLKNALSVYQVIPRAMIQAQGAVTLDNVLSHQLNMSVSNDPILGSSVNVQGLSSNKVKILMDGAPINGRQGGSINLSQINLNNIDRIEIIQGPMGVVYGTDALAGVINLITKKDSKKLNIQAGTYLESIGKYNVDGSVSFKIKDRNSFTIGGGRNFFQGWKYLDVPVYYKSDKLLVQRNLFYKPDEQYLVNLGYNYTAPKGFRLQASSNLLFDKIINRGQIQAWDPFIGCYAIDEYYHTNRYMNTVSVEDKIGKSGHWTTLAGYMVYDHIREMVRKDMTTLKETLTTGKGDQDSSYFKDVTLRSTYNNHLGKLNYTAGYDIALQYAHSTRITQGKTSIGDYAFFANLSRTIYKDKLTAQLGARASYNTAYQTPVIPNFNLLYTPIQKLQLRASYAYGFRTPTLKELYLSFVDASHNLNGNPNLKSEESKAVQLSGSYQLYEKQADYTQIILTEYFNDVRNGINLVNMNPANPNSIDYKYGNIARNKNVISNLQVDGQVHNFHYQVGFALNHTFADPQGAYNAFSKFESSAVLQYNFKKSGTNVNVFYNFYGPQSFLQTAITGDLYYNGRQEAYQMCDASIEQRILNKKVHVICGMKNIFNVTSPKVTGMAVSGGTHGTGSAGSFFPRTIYTSVRLSID